MTPLITCQNVKKNYPDFTLCADIDIMPGQITGLVGCNGAGKSTLFKLMLGLIKADDGKIQVLSQDIANLPVSVKEQFGCVFSDSGFQQDFTAADVEKILAASYSGFDPDFYHRLLKQLDLPADKKLKDFSTGMLARFRMMAAISHKPNLLFLDEPTAGLDVIARDEILDLVREFMEAPDHSVLISSHNARDLESLCDDFYFIDHGKILLHETMDELLSSYAILKADDKTANEIGDEAVLARLARPYGWDLLISSRQYIQENWPEAELEKSSVDDLIEIMVLGEKRKAGKAEESEDWR